MTSGLPSPWEYAGCYVSVQVFFSFRNQLHSCGIIRDNAYGRVMSNELPDNQNLTVESCIANCTAENYTLAGLEYSVQCCKCSLCLYAPFLKAEPFSCLVCTDTLVNGAVQAAESDCNMGCGANATFVIDLYILYTNFLMFL